MIQSGNSFISFPQSQEVVSNIKYGYLYNWYAASNSLFAPVGWHLPTQAEYITLVTFLGGAAIAGGKLKESGLTYWIDPNTGAINSVGFNARGGGVRGSGAGTFSGIQETGYHWTTTEDTENIGFYHTLFLENYTALADTINGYSAPKIGNSVRLIKDNSTLVASLTDIDSNVYRTTKIGNQVWLADNWACTKLSNGTAIPNVTDNTAWAALVTGAYCAYDNDINNAFIIP